MARDLRQNTATRITVGPFLDKTDGITPETGLTATNEKITFVVDDSGVPTLVIDATATASGGDNDLVHITNDDAGFYDLELTAAQVNYVGRAILNIGYATDHLPVFHEFNILTQAEWDAKYGTGSRKADVIALSGDTAAADNAEAFFDGTGYAGTNNVIPTVTTVTNLHASAATAAELAKVPKSDSNVTFNATAVAGIQSGLATPTNITAASGVTLTAAYDAAKTAATQASIDTIDGIVDTIVSRIVGTIAAGTHNPQSGDAYAIVNNGTYGNSALNTALGTIAGYLDTEVAAILAAVDTEVAAILADTNELQTDWANGGRLDLLIDAIKAKTDSLAFTVAGQVDSNVQSINDAALTGDGSATPWGPA